MASIPEVLNDYRVYREGNNSLVGIASVEFPSEEALTVTVKGTGIAGKVEAPVTGHYGEMETKVNFTTPTEESQKLAAGEAVAFEFMGAIQNWNSARNDYDIIPSRYVVRGRIKSKEHGSWESGNQVTQAITISTTYLKVEHNDKVVREIDKYAYVDKNGSTDRLEAIRSALGM